MKNMLKFFQKDTNRDKVYASVEGYQLNLVPVVNKAKQLNSNNDELPSWSKFVANPVKGRGFYVTLIEAMFKGKHNLSGVDIELLVQFTNSDLQERRIAMIFFPDNTKVDNLNKIGDITKDNLNGWTVVVLNGKTVTSNAECEYTVKNAIENNKGNVLIIASKMAQRSFSEELISELYLAYDKGQDGATIQKMSRSLTSNTSDKIARIFSLSFDPNRDDKLDTMVFQSALNQVEKKGKSDIREELKRVYKSIDIYSCSGDGEAIKLSVDDYVKQSLQKKGICRVIGKKSNLSLLTNTQVKALLGGNVDYLRNEIKERAETGKTKDIKSKESESVMVDKASKNDVEKVREVVISMIEHSDVIMLSAKNKGAKNITEALQVFEDNKWTPIIEEEFGVKYEVVKYLYTMGVIKEDWVNLIYG
jgi:hypothetical protein